MYANHCTVVHVSKRRCTGKLFNTEDGFPAVNFWENVIYEYPYVIYGTQCMERMTFAICQLSRYGEEITCSQMRIFFSNTITYPIWVDHFWRHFPVLQYQAFTIHMSKRLVYLPWRHTVWKLLLLMFCFAIINRGITHVPPRTSCVDWGEFYRMYVNLWIKSSTSPVGKLCFGRATTQQIQNFTY